MKRILAIMGTAGLMAPVLAAQTPSGSVERRQAVELAAQATGMARVALETRITRGKPYSAEAVTEFVQILGDGNRIVRKSTARQFRDSEGRTRREDLGDNGSVLERSSVVITDPVAGSSYILNPAMRTAMKSPGMFARVEGGTVSVQGSTKVDVVRRAPEPKVEIITVPGPRSRNGEQGGSVTVVDPVAGGATAFTLMGAGGRGGVAPGESSKQDLGQQVIEGVTATGTRTTTVIAAGTIGNEQPITIVSEQWFSDDLGMLVLTRHNDPRVGETTYRLINISRNEPDRSLFQVPADYTVQDRPPVLLRQRQQQ
jgi:hypothetical protein